MALPTTWTGLVSGTLRDSDYRAIRYQLWSYFEKRGTVRIPDDDAAWPALSNGELVALAVAWKRAAARSKAPTWPQWYDLVVSGLGWHQDGDRFVMSLDHMKAPAPPSTLKLFWLTTGDLAEQLDGAGTVLRPLIVDWSRSAYEQAARDAWTQMKVNREVTQMPPMPVPGGGRPGDPPAKPKIPPELVPDPSDLAPLPSVGGGLLLVLLLLAALSRKRKGN